MCSSKAEEEFQLNDNILDEEFSSNQALARYGKESVYRTYNSFMMNGFTPTNAFDVIKKHPPIVRYPPNKLTETLEIWRGCQFSQTQFFQLVVQCPEILEFTDEKYVVSRITAIKGYAEKTKNVWRLLMASPNVITDKMTTFNAKAKYLQSVMDVDVTDATKSGVFAYPLLKIKCRHMLLVRLGLYRPRPKNANPLDPNKNPRVTKIVDTPDAEFARKVCKISLAEFEAFNALYEREAQENEEAEMDEQELADKDYRTDDEEDVSDDEFQPDRETNQYDDRHKRRYDMKLQKRRKKENQKNK